MLDIIQAQSPQHTQFVRDLIAEYVAWDTQITAAQGIDPALLQYQYSDSGLELPGDFVPPDGRLLLALWNGQPAGCAAIHKFDTDISELKRLYVRPEYRDKGIGRALIEAIIAAARDIGYTTLRLESATFMTDAHSLYYAYGFKVVPPYYEIPDGILPISVFMEQELTPNA